MGATLPLKFGVSQLEACERQRAAITGKDLAAGFNKKMAWLLRRWLWYTKKADSGKMARQLGVRLRLGRSGQKTTRTGKVLKFKGGWKITSKTFGTVRSKRLQDQGAMVPLIVALIQKNKKGSPFKGKTRAEGRRAMAALVKKKIGLRFRSIGYLKSAIASAQKPFLSFASGNSGPPQDNDRNLKAMGRPKGFGTLAVPGTRVLAVAVDKSVTKKQGDKGLRDFAIPAFERAYKEELADTQQFLEKLINEAANKAGLKTRR